MGLGFAIFDRFYRQAAVPGLKAWLWRHGMSVAYVTLLCLFAALHALAPHVYLFFTRIPDGVAKLHPFVDLRAILQGGACWRQGVDVYKPSACLGGGEFNYSPLLLRLAWLPIGPRDTLAGGLLFCAAYGWALVCLPAPAGRPLLLGAAAFSPAAYYALEQGNLDTVIFAGSVLALRLLGRHRIWAYALFACGAAAKFYPGALFILALREGRRTLGALALAAGAGGILVLALDGHAVLTALRQIPSGTPFRASFGRIDLSRGLAMLHFLSRGMAGGVSWILAGVAGAVAWKRRVAWAKALARLDDEAALFLVAGAAVTAFCFLAAQNIEYRALFLLLMLPGLSRVAACGWGFRVLPLLIVVLLWESVPRAWLGGLAQPYLPTGPAFCFWLLREVLWWWLEIECLAAVFAFALAFSRQKLTGAGNAHNDSTLTQGA
jgi:hypothetical protein